MKCKKSVTKGLKEKLNLYTRYKKECFKIRHEYGSGCEHEYDKGCAKILKDHQNNIGE